MPSQAPNGNYCGTAHRASSRLLNPGCLRQIPYLGSLIREANAILQLDEPHHTTSVRAITVEKSGTKP